MESPANPSVTQENPPVDKTTLTGYSRYDREFNSAKITGNILTYPQLVSVAKAAAKHVSNESPATKFDLRLAMQFAGLKEFPKIPSYADYKANQEIALRKAGKVISNVSTNLQRTWDNGVKLYEVSNLKQLVEYIDKNNDKIFNVSNGKKYGSWGLIADSEYFEIQIASLVKAIKEYPYTPEVEAVNSRFFFLCLEFKTAESIILKNLEFYAAHASSIKKTLVINFTLVNGKIMTPTNRGGDYGEALKKAGRALKAPPLIPEEDSPEALLAVKIWNVNMLLTTSDVRALKKAAQSERDPYMSVAARLMSAFIGYFIPEYKAPKDYDAILLDYNQCRGGVRSAQVAAIKALSSASTGRTTIPIKVPVTF
jgi:hypothetical protein